MKITAITCTGDRPGAMALCERWLAAQSRQPDRWIIVDDGHTPTPIPAWRSAAGEGPIVLRPEPMEGHSLMRNVRVALEHVRDNPLYRPPPLDEANRVAGTCEPEAVAFIEDDDHYAPYWLEKCERHLLTFTTDRNGARQLPAVVGEAEVIYYNARYRRYFRWPNYQHSSLAATAIRTELIPWILTGRPLRDGENPSLIDWRLWDADRQGNYRANRRLWLHDTEELPGVIGMKGMPGRGGMAGGHRPDQMNEHWKSDPAGHVLRSLLGEDYWSYAALYVPPTPAELAEIARAASAAPVSASCPSSCPSSPSSPPRSPPSPSIPSAEPHPCPKTQTPSRSSKTRKAPSPSRATRAASPRTPSPTKSRRTSTAGN